MERDAGPEKRVYAITNAGLAELEVWFACGTRLSTSAMPSSEADGRAGPQATDPMPCQHAAHRSTAPAR